jgi:hypothetical protein
MTTGKRVRPSVKDVLDSVRGNSVDALGSLDRRVSALERRVSRDG